MEWNGRELQTCGVSGGDRDGQGMEEGVREMCPWQGVGSVGRVCCSLLSGCTRLH